MKKSTLRTWGILLLNFVLLFALYQLLLRYELIWGTALYVIAAGALTVAYFIVNRGFGRPQDEADTLPADRSPQKKCAYLAERQAAHGRARVLLYWLLPLIVVLGIDFFLLYFGDTIKEALAALG